MEIFSFLPQFGSVFSTLVAFVVALSVIVAIHEYGHYIVARWCGIHAEVFSLGFGPVLFSREDKRGTRWQVALLPFGGFVKFFGDSNPASAKNEVAVDEMTPEERRHTLYGAPLWARTATVAAGPVFNFILSISVFAVMLMLQGRAIEPLTVGELKPLPVQGVTLEPGDLLIRVGQVAVPTGDDQDFDDFIADLPTQALLEYEVGREGRTVTVMGPHIMPPLITQLMPQSAAYSTGLKQGDVILAVDGSPIYAFSELKDIVESSDGRELALEVWRDGETLDFELKPKRVDDPQPEGGFKTEWRIGIAGGMAFVPATETRGFIDAVKGGVEQTGSIISGSLSGLYHMVTGAISSCNMSGPIGIAQVSGAMASQGTSNFIWFIAVLSTAVGMLNLFPIPVLDGGHLLFYAYEAVAGKPPSDKALRIFMTVGLTLILSLMVFALGNDIFCP